MAVQQERALGVWQSVVALFRESPRDLMLIFGMIAILIALFTPIPAFILDFLLITNFSLGLLMLLMAFSTDKPLRFSTFPSLLLIATLFRLSLNISATRLILADADAGKVIDSIGTYVVGGNYAIGLVVFLILVVVQYVVVTNGAQRVAEVAARFTLDSMPGKQMSIDADLNMGLIDEHEAKQRRANIEREANFYGAMDGATKFVKGDAIAGIIIILIDIIGGLSIGLAQHGMSWSDALQTYTLLTVGDGIVTQIPSLVIAVATGILITRAATDARLGDEVATQVTSNPRTLSLVALSLGILLLLPGLPFFPVLVLVCVFSLGTVYAVRKARSADNDDHTDPADQKNDADDFTALLELQPVELLLGRNAARFVEGEKLILLEQFRDLRRRTAETMGLICPEIKVGDSAVLGANEYAIRFAGVTVGSGSLYAERMLAINPGGERAALEGEETREPAYNLPATWIEKHFEDEAKSRGYTLVSPETLLLTHFQELVGRKGYELLTRSATEELVENAKATNGRSGG